MPAPLPDRAPSGRRLGLPGLAAQVGAAGLGLSAPSPAMAHDYAIVGGTETETCNWPSAVNIKGCTGTLIHPEIVTSAGHCSITGQQTVVFGETRGASLRVGAECFRNPDYDDRNPAGNDYAYCKLERPVDEVPIVHPMMGCESDYLREGVPVVGVGFGQINFNDVPSGGIKRQVETEVVGLAGREVLVGDIWHGFCAGDSGGPVYVKLPDDQFGENAGWRVFGITSRSGPGGGFCASSTYFNRISVAIPWIEEASGIDVTPCHDADGTWNPGPECKGAILEPQSGGSWPSCNAGPKGGYMASCGDPFDDSSTSSGGDESSSESGDEGSEDETGDDETGDEGSEDETTGDDATEAGDTDSGPESDTEGGDTHSDTEDGSGSESDDTDEGSSASSDDTGSSEDSEDSQGDDEEEDSASSNADTEGDDSQSSGNSDSDADDSDDGAGQAEGTTGTTDADGGSGCSILPRPVVRPRGLTHEDTRMRAMLNVLGWLSSRRP